MGIATGPADSESVLRGAGSRVLGVGTAIRPRKSIARKKRDLKGRVRRGAGGCGKLQAMTCQSEGDDG